MATTADVRSMARAGAGAGAGAGAVAAAAAGGPDGGEAQGRPAGRLALPEQQQHYPLPSRPHRDIRFDDRKRLST
ncbi:hypothetical protein E4U42_007467 [Claviceps africana]|uniref:Uncharacterized protein n=1 Tax=Claviceps africana TaxID=83212 RepID=A0A8K0J1B8_9HYPO|nr:hypothetical protein E4U42_007467 [Claviceps africana]